MANKREIVFVRFRALSNEKRFGITFLKPDGGPWKSPTIGYGESVTFTFISNREGGPDHPAGQDFWFRALNFWGRKIVRDQDGNDKKEIVSNVVRTFEDTTDGEVRFDLEDYGGSQGRTIFIDGVNTIRGSNENGPGRQEFTIHNRNDSNLDGEISIQVTFEDRSTQSTGGLLFTSADPEVIVPKK